MVIFTARPRRGHSSVTAIEIHGAAGQAIGAPSGAAIHPSHLTGVRT